MSVRRWFPVLLLLASFSIPSAASGEAKILFPPDHTLTLENKVKIFVFAPDAKAPLPFTVNGRYQGTLKGEAFQSGEANLDRGTNILNIRGMRLKLFYLVDSKADELRLPGEMQGEEVVYRAYRLHPALDDGCEACHALEGGKLKPKDQKEACYACHDDFEKKAEGGGDERSVHPPVKAGECTGCHDPHFASRPKLQKLEKGCFECHDPFPSEGTVHFPLANKECTPCHNPHAGPGPKLVDRKGNALCLKCHQEFHVQHRSAEVKGKGGMTQVPPDIPRDKEDLACLACHVPHQSAERRLFRKNQGDLCKTCHQM